MLKATDAKPRQGNNTHNKIANALYYSLYRLTHG